MMSASTSQLKIYPLGGVGEIGRNLMVWEYGDWRLLIDCGLTFPEDAHLGVDYILPDWHPLVENPFPNQAVLITHGHDDHIGALPFFLKECPCPVYGTAFAMSLVQSKLDEHRVKKIPLHVIAAGDRFQLGPFSVEALHVNHSIPQVVAFAIGTPFGRVVHVTDWKIDRTPIAEAIIDEPRFRALGQEGTLLLFSDSTNAENHGATLSETSVGEKLDALCRKVDGRLFVTLFASNGARIKQVVEIGKRLGRKVALCGRSLSRNTDIFKELEIFDFPRDHIVSLEDAVKLPDNEVLFVLTGSQAEPRSLLYRMSYGGHKLLKVREGDTIIFSSKMIPGNERAITRMINQFCRYGARVIYEDIAEVHTSGHAKQDELSALLEWLKPHYFVPIHGEYRHLMRHAELAIESGVPADQAIVIENGQSLIINETGVKLGDKLEVGRLFIDGSGLGDISEDILRDRRYLSKTGVLLCFLMINADTGEIVRGPEFLSKGFVNEEEVKDILEKAKTRVIDAVETFDWQARTNTLELEEYIHLILRQFFNKVAESKPLMIPLVIEV